MHPVTMTATPETRIDSKLSSLAYECFRDLELQTYHDWDGIDTIGDLPNDSLIYSTLNYYQRGADDFVATTVLMALEISQSPEAYVVFSKNVDLFLEFCISTLNQISVRSTASEIVQVFSDVKLSEFRRRIERLVDSHRGRFNGGVAADTGNNRANQSNNLGRKPKYDWPKVISQVWGEIHLGTLKVHKQKDIEARLVHLLGTKDHIPNETTVRPIARIIMHDYQYDPMDEN